MRCLGVVVCECVCASGQDRPHADLPQLFDVLAVLGVFCLQLQSQLAQTEEELVVGVEQGVERLLKTAPGDAGLLFQIRGPELQRLRELFNLTGP